jgi:integrase
VTVATVKLAYVQAFKDRHGRWRYYYRRRGRRFTLPGRPGEEAFMRAYEAAAAAFENPTPIRSLTPREGSFDSLIEAYYRSPTFQLLSPSTQATRRGIIERWRSKNGSKRVAHLERRHVVEFVGERMKASGPWAANNFLSILRSLMSFAVEGEWRKDDPTQGVKPIRAKTDGFATWSEADIAKYEKRWKKGTRERLALALLIYTGQRRGDVIRMGWRHVQGDTIRVKQSKTGAALTIPLHPELRSVIAKTPRGHLTFLTTRYDRPFTAAGFGNAFRDWCDAAGLPGRSAHGLRKAAARRLAEAGCTASQIGAITGHKTLKEVSRYTAAADQQRMARAAMDKLR